MKFSNMKNTEAGSTFEPLPKGRYNFILSGAEEKISQTGNPYYRLEFTCVDDNTDELKTRGRKVWGNINSNEIGAKQMKELLVANQNEMSEASEDIEITPEVLVGMRVNGQLNIETYNDVARNGIRYYQPIDEQYEHITIDEVKVASTTATADTFEAPPTEDNPFTK